MGLDVFFPPLCDGFPLPLCNHLCYWYISKMVAIQLRNKPLKNTPIELPCITTSKFKKNYFKKMNRDPKKYLNVVRVF